jgi:hypothetical protein
MNDADLEELQKLQESDVQLSRLIRDLKAKIKKSEEEEIEREAEKHILLKLIRAQSDRLQQVDKEIYPNQEFMD